MKFPTLPPNLKGPACTFGLTLGLALFNFVSHSSLLDLLIGSKLRHRFPSLFGFPKWISNITGTSTCVDDVKTAMIGPFPELNDFNAITAMVKLPVVLKGLAPDCRYWSIQAFLSGGKEIVSGEMIVCDREFEIGEDGSYTLTISSTKPKEGSWINSGGGTMAKMIVIRAFCCNPGSGWRAPDIYGKDGKVIKMAETERIAGPCALSRTQTSGPMTRLTKSLIVNASLLLAFPEHARTIVMGGMGAAMIRKHLLRKVDKKMRKGLLVGRKIKPNVDVSIPEAKASLGGSAKHSYFTMIYDAREGDVVVNGTLRWTKDGQEMFRYTSVTCYEFTSLPLPSYFDDRSLKGSMVPTKDKETYSVILTTKPTRKKGLNEIDVSKYPLGVVVVRLVYPVNDDVLDVCKPEISMVVP